MKSKSRLSPINYVCMTLFLIWVVIITDWMPSSSSFTSSRQEFETRTKATDDPPLAATQDDDEIEHSSEIIAEQSNDSDMAVTITRTGEDDYVGRLPRIETVINFGKYAGNDTNFVSNPGVPRDSHRWKGDVSSIKTWRDLPRIFPRELPKDDGPAAIQAGAASNPGSTTVCVFNRTPRQRSLFSSGIMALFGSGKYHYKSMEATNCQFFGTCPEGTPEESRRHPECDPKRSPTVGLVEWVSFCGGEGEKTNRSEDGKTKKTH